MSCLGLCLVVLGWVFFFLKLDFFSEPGCCCGWFWGFFSLRTKKASEVSAYVANGASPKPVSRWRPPSPSRGGWGWSPAGRWERTCLSTVLERLIRPQKGPPWLKHSWLRHFSPSVASDLTCQVLQLLGDKYFLGAPSFGYSLAIHRRRAVCKITA